MMMVLRVMVGSHDDGCDSDDIAVHNLQRLRSPCIDAAFRRGQSRARRERIS